MRTLYICENYTPHWNSNKYNAPYVHVFGPCTRQKLLSMKENKLKQAHVHDVTICFLIVLVIMCIP